jgi:hypothetical protein
MGRDEKKRPSKSPRKLNALPKRHQDPPPRTPGRSPKKKIVTTRTDRVSDLIDTGKGKKYRCPKAKANGTVCGALIQPFDHNIGSHNSTQHQPKSAYSQKQNASSTVKGCISSVFCEAEIAKHEWPNFNTYLRHMRGVHGFRGSEKTIEHQLIGRARGCKDTNDPWYHVARAPLAGDDEAATPSKRKLVKKAAKVRVGKQDESDWESSLEDPDEEINDSDDDGEGIFDEYSPPDRKPDDDFPGGGPAIGGAIPPIAVA